MKTAIIILALLCAGCDTKSYIDHQKRSSEFRNKLNQAAPSEVMVFLDSGTGCEYVGSSDRAITPRMGADGKQICRKVAP